MSWGSGWKIQQESGNTYAWMQVLRGICGNPSHDKLAPSYTSFLEKLRPPPLVHYLSSTCRKGRQKGKTGKECSCSTHRDEVRVSINMPVICNSRPPGCNKVQQHILGFGALGVPTFLIGCLHQPGSHQSPSDSSLVDWRQLRGKFKLTKVIPVDTNSAEHPQTPKTRQDLNLRHAHWVPTWAGHSTIGCVLTEFPVLRRKSPGDKFSRHSTEQHWGVPAT